MSNPLRCFRLIAPLAVLWATSQALEASAFPSLSGYTVTVLPAHPNHPSTYPKAMDEIGVLTGIAGSDPWDNVAVPIVSVGDKIVSLRKPFGSLNFAVGIGSTRLIVGTSALQPVAWVNGLPTVLQPAAGLFQGEARDANVAGVICGTLVNDLTGAQRAIVWPTATSPGNGLSLGAATGSAALAISENGRIVGSVYGGAYAAYDFVGARWDNASLQPAVILPLAGATNCELASVNDAGDSAGRCGFPNSTVEAVFHDQQSGNLIGLGFLPTGNYSEARGVNGSRVVVGVSNQSGGSVHAFRWENGVMQDLNSMVLSSNVPIVTVTNAVGINDLGLIAAEVEVSTGAGLASRMAIFRPVVH